jgi:histidyl-tRNA synthetase
MLLCASAAFCRRSLTTERFELVEYRIPTGTKDTLPADIPRWHHVEKVIGDVMRRFNYKEIRTPVFEYTELFTRGIGESTDVVGKEMYTFLDKGKESLTLRPEMTASVVRSYLENNLGSALPLNKLYYLGPMFRQERPQKGRLRQFMQFGVEAIGSAMPEQDVETMLVAMTVYEELGLKDLTFKINSVGCPACRPAYRDALVRFLDAERHRLSPDSVKRLETNPMRILDSKNEQDLALTANAPLMKDHLCGECRTHFDRVQRALAALHIEFEVDGRLVRGLDYYTRTAYEIQSGSLGSQNALGGGGRYDLLAESLGGPPTPAVGFAAGIERLLLVMEAQQLPFGEPDVLDLFWVALGEAAMMFSIPYIHALRKHGYRCDVDYLNRSMKAQLREANRQQARYVVIVGDQELQQAQCQVKNMSTGEQSAVPIDSVIQFLQSALPL